MRAPNAACVVFVAKGVIQGGEGGVCVCVCVWGGGGLET